MFNVSFETRWASHGIPWGEISRIDPRDAESIAGHIPLWRVVNWALSGQETQEYRVSSGFDFSLASIAGDSSQAAGFKANIYDAGRKRVILDVPASSFNLAGAGGRPMILHRIYAIPAYSAILIRIQNLATAGNSGQLVLFGYGERESEPS